MATRAEMEAELEFLKAKLAESDAEKTADAAPETETPKETAPDPAADADPVTSADPGPSLSMDHAKSELDRLLTPYGISVEEIEDLAEQLWAELETMPQKKPLTSVIAAFALGFLVGRLSK